MWTLEYEADIASDLSAFHRVDDPMTISGPRYFSLAMRLTAYAGVMAAIAEQRRQDEENGHSSSPSAAPGASSGTQRVDDSIAIAQLSDGWLEHTTTGIEE